MKEKPLTNLQVASALAMLYMLIVAIVLAVDVTLHNVWGYPQFTDKIALPLIITMWPAFILVMVGRLSYNRY